MLQINVPPLELYDELNEEFISVKGQTLQLEHSLVSISKWESKWHKPFLSKDDKTREETLDYIRCMTLTQNVPESIYSAITDSLIQQITDYIAAPMTATTFSEQKHTSREVITSEIIYYWMVAMTIPFECQKWHLNRLLTLINVCSIKNQPPGKMSRKEVLNRQHSLNQARRQALNSKG